MFKSYGISFVIIFCFALVEVSILSNITFLPAVPDLVLLASIYISLLNGRGMGEVCGFSSGLVLDFFSGAPFGFNCIFRTVISYVAGFFGRYINYRGFVIPFVIGLCGTFSKALLVWIVSLFYTSVGNYNIFSLTFLFELVLNGLLAPLVFRLMDCFKRQISTGNGDFD